MIHMTCSRELVVTGCPPPLPLKRNHQTLPNNKTQALQRARSFDKNLRHNPDKFEHVREFMLKLFDRGHAEKAPELKDDKERWYLPMFGVYHPKKPGSIILWHVLRTLH